MASNTPGKKIAVIGAGPAGMACAYTLAQAGRRPMVLECESEPGGLCRTLDFYGYLFDIGGHRFLTKSDEIGRLWHTVMGDDMLRVKRVSRIYFHRNFINYPLSFFNTFFHLGLIESIRSVASCFWCVARKPGDDKTFEGWIINRFGKRLYDIFFRTYTEKVWAIACEDISADWAIQRIRGLSLRVALRKAVFGRGEEPKTLAGEFLYPRTGPGEFYRRFEQMISGLGCEFLYRKEVTDVKWDQGKVTSVIAKDGLSGRREEFEVDSVFSTMPLPLLIGCLGPRVPKEISEAARRLRFRCFLVVNVILRKESIFPDQWIYVHDPNVKMGRIQNYKNWSAGMTPDPYKTSLGLEYFCTEGDELWNMSDVDLINFAMGELNRLGIAARKDLINGFVVRSANAYPIYSLGYEKDAAILRNYLAGFENLQTLGRGGLFQYGNSDHALLSGIYAVKNFLGEGPYDVWAINADREYLES